MKQSFLRALCWTDFARKPKPYYLLRNPSPSSTIMGCFPSKQVNDGRALDRSSISHQTQYPTQSLHDADTESVVFTAGRPSFGFNQIPPGVNQQMASSAAATPPRKSLGSQSQPGRTKPMLPAHLQLQSNYTATNAGGNMQQVVSSVGATLGSAGIGGRPSLSRGRSFGREPMSAGAIGGVGGKPKVSFAAQLMLKEREKEMMWEPQAGGHGLPPMTAPPTRETFGR